MCGPIVRISPVASGLGSRPAGAWPHQRVGARSRVDGSPVGGIWTTGAAMPYDAQRSTKPGSRASSRAWKRSQHVWPADDPRRMAHLPLHARDARGVRHEHLDIHHNTGVRSVCGHHGPFGSGLDTPGARMGLSIEFGELLGAHPCYRRIRVGAARRGRPPPFGNQLTLLP